ncbi:hypothetical protein LCGC14_0929520 [marine sediment metagenome]|uniref:Uncharacterized protein n=1 Tax=marine sediment metagenome TaxID=412755 RepID=A0A0F9P9B2_9ZZZZ
MVDNVIPSQQLTTEQKFLRLQELRKKSRLFELQQKKLGFNIELEEGPELEINLDPDKAVVPTQEPLVAPEEERFPTGAVIGGTAGSIAGIPGGPPAMAGLASLGSAGGEAIQQIIEQITSDPNAPQTTKEAMQRIGQEGVFGLIAEAGGQGIVRGVRTLKNTGLAPFADSLLPEDIAAIQAFERLGIQPTPFDITRRTFVGRLESFAGQGLISGGILKRFNNKRINLFKAFQNRFLEKTGPKKVMSALGEFAESSFDDTIKILDDEAGRLFAKAESLAGETKIIPTAELKVAANTILGQEALVTKGLQFRSIQRLANEMKELPEFITFKQAREIQKRLGAKTAKLKNLPEGEVKQLFKGIAESIESAQFKGKGDKQEALTVLREAKDRFIEMLELQKSGLGKKIVGKDPEDLFRGIFQTGDVTNIKALRSIIGERDWPMFQRAFADDLMSKGNIENFNQIMDKQQMESLQQVFTDGQIQVLQDIATIAERFRPGELAQSARVRPGFNLINIGQGGLMVNLALGERGVGDNRLAQGLIVLSPPMIAKLLTSQTGVRWLTVGLRLTNDHPLAAQAMQNITDVLIGSASRTIAADPKTRSRFIKQFKDSGLPIQQFFPNLQKPDGTFNSVEDFRRTITGE